MYAYFETNVNIFFNLINFYFIVFAKTIALNA
jgi:hypothetical protein